MTTVTHTPPIAIEEILTQEIARTERRPPFWGRPWKMRALLFLLGGLAILLLLQLFITHIPNSEPVPTTCVDLMRTADYAQAVGLQSQTQQMAAVQMVNDLDGGAPAALVQVMNQDAQNTLDVYIFGCIMQQQHPRLTRLLASQGLLQGIIELTPQHTLTTEALDNKLPPGAVAFLQPLQQNVYQEYGWQQGHFVQIPFPGFYPVTSKVEAQTLQQGFDHGQSVPWNDPLATALQMSKDLLQWSSTPQTRLISQSATTAIVELSAQNPHIVVDVTLKRLIQTDNRGLWFVTDARSPGVLLTRSGTLNQPFVHAVTSPIAFSGANVLIDGHTSATLFDHTLTPVEQDTNLPVNVHPDSTYAGTIVYANLISGQQGVLSIQSLPLPQNNAKESGQVLLTGVILN